MVELLYWRRYIVSEDYSRIYPRTNRSQELETDDKNLLSTIVIDITRQRGHVVGSGVVVVRQAINTVQTEEVLAAVGEFEDHPVGRPEVEAPEIADPAGDLDLRVAAVTPPCRHWR